MYIISEVVVELVYQNTVIAIRENLEFRAAR